MREVADAFQVADDAGHVVDVLAVAHWTLFQVAFVDMATVVADGVGYVEGEIVAPLCSRHAQQLAVLLFGQMLVQIEVQGAAASEVLDVGGTVELEFVEDGE